MKNKSGSVKLCGIGATFNLAAAVVFVIYGAVYDYLDYVVVISLVLGIICAVGYCMVNSRLTEFLNLLQVVIASYGLGLFALNSFPVWADRLNDIDMYGARGSLVPVVLIILLFVITIFFAIASCFTRKEVA